MLCKSGFAHTNGPWERSLICSTEASSGRHECNILPVYFIQQAYFLLLFKGKCLLPPRQFLSVAILCFMMNMGSFFYPALWTVAFCLLSPNFSVLTHQKYPKLKATTNKKKPDSTLLFSHHCLGKKHVLIICILASRTFSTLLQLTFCLRMGCKLFIALLMSVFEKFV